MSSGEIGPHSSIKLEIVWSSTIPIKVHAEFVVAFADPLSDNVSMSHLNLVRFCLQKDFANAVMSQMLIVLNAIVRHLFRDAHLTQRVKILQR